MIALKWSVCVVLLFVASLSEIRAFSPMSEDELDQTHAAGIELQIIGDETTIVDVEVSDLFANQIFGLNEVITRVVMQIVTTMDFTLQQTNKIDQSRVSQDIAGIAEGSRDVRLSVAGAPKKRAVRAVINNVAGTNQIETSINIAVILPASHTARAGSLSNPYAVAGPQPSATPSTPINQPVRVLQPITPQFEMPTTFGGALSLLDSLAQENPQMAPDLRSFASELGSIPP